jgi:tRNA(Ile)-lysidine synthase
MSLPPDTSVVFEQQFAAAFLRLVDPGSRCLVAVSGGIDSMALLELLYRTRAEHHCVMVVGHVDHGIAPESAVVAERVSLAARARGLDVVCRVLTLGARASETTARTARRAALRAMAAELECPVIVVGHQADDQAETVLMRTLRGTGPVGLAAMQARRGAWVRPMLTLTRAELVAYLGTRAVDAWQDPANTDPAHLRSWLRTAALPVLRARIPDVEAHLRRVAHQASDLRAAWNSVVLLLPGLDLRRELRGISVAAPVLRGYRSPLRRAIVAAVGRQCGVRLGARRLRAVDALLASAAGAGVIDLDRCTRAELGFGRLTLFKVETLSDLTVLLALDSSTRLDRAVLQVRRDSSAVMARVGWSTGVRPGRYVARRWQRGDRMVPIGGCGSRSVAVLLREARIPVAQRATWPVVVTADDATIVWVPGICRADVAVPEKGTETWRVECAFT